MDFSSVLRSLVVHLEAEGIRHAVVGGVAMAAYGLPRTTLDLDLVVEAKDQERLVRYLEDRGYRTLYCSSGYSNHLHPEPNLGRIDLVYVDGETAAKLFRDTRRVPGPGDLEVPVPSPEHLAAMKIQALKNDAARRFLELNDLRHLVTAAGADREFVRRQFARHGLEETYHELEATL